MRTTSTPIAIFLVAKGINMVGTGYDGSRGAVELVFPDSEEVKNLVEKYKFAPDSDADLLVDVKRLEVARDRVMARIRGE